MNLGTLLFGFQGRLGRTSIWSALLIWFVVYAAISAIWYFLEIAVSPASSIVGFVISIPFYVSIVAVSIRRLHDRDKSGWWLLVFYLAPTLFIFFGIVLMAFVPSQLALWVALPIMAWAVFELGFRRGSIGPNQYGPDPLMPA